VDSKSRYNKYMIDISDEEFAQLMTESLDEMPHEHMQAVRNVAIVYADDPTPDQREQLALRHDQTLFGLYEGVPLAKRLGSETSIPDKITIFKHPIVESSSDRAELKAHIKHTIWHELAHYFGLDHPAIHALEQKPRS
jgi:predicted Zn-dependent protease with MMP-like domain